MKRNKTIGTLTLLLMTLSTIMAQDVTTVDAMSDEISDNLNLEAVASIFGEAKDLEEFEYQLNDPDTRISNLDLNEDGQVDYLRVVETAEEDVHVIALQSVLAEDVYQDVAMITVDKDNTGETRVQFIGDVYLYGPDYIVQPVYVRRPLIFSWFWRPYYRPYRSVYYWGFYPKHYAFWKPVRRTLYTKNVHVHINVKHSFHYTKVRYSPNAVRLHTKIRRNDYAVKYPHKSHTVRVAQVKKGKGTHKRTVRATQANGTTKRVTAVTKANGTKKRRATVKGTDGSRKSIAVKQNPNGSKRAVAVKKDAQGNKTVKTSRKRSASTKKKKVTRRKKR